MSLNRNTLLTVAASAGLLGAVAASRCAAADPVALPPAHATAAGADHDGEAKGEGHAGKPKEKEIEQPVPMNMVPQPVVDAVMKECPGGKITAAELEAKKGKILWDFDVTVGDAKYGVKVTVDGKFYSKKVDADDDGDEKHDEKRGEKQ